MVGRNQGFQSTVMRCGLLPFGVCLLASVSDYKTRQREDENRVSVAVCFSAVTLIGATCVCDYWAPLSLEAQNDRLYRNPMSASRLARTVADGDGLFATRQIVAALYGAFDQEKLQTQAQITRKLELHNALMTAGVLDRAEVTKVLGMIADAMTTRIMAAEVPRSVKEDLLHDLASIPLVLKGVAHAQTGRQRANGKRNGDGNGLDD